MTETPALNEFQRIVGVFTSPANTFRDIAARPRWFVPVILILVTSFCFSFLISKRVGFERIIEKSIDQSTRSQTMSPEQRVQAIKMGSKIAPIVSYVAPAIIVPAVILTAAAIFMLLTNALFSGRVQFNQMAGITAYSWLPQVISLLLSMLVLQLKDPEDFDVNNPSVFNVGAYLGDSAPKWLLSLGTAMDLFSLWTIILLAIGIMTLTGKRQWGKALVVVVAPWVVVTLIRAGWAALFS